MGKPDEATRELREYIRMVRAGAVIYGGNYLSHLEGLLRTFERVADLQRRLDGILRGENAPANAEEMLEVARLCQANGRFEGAVRFYREAFLAKPQLAEDLKAQRRIHAAITAAKSSNSQELQKDGRPFDDDVRSELRAQTLRWLRDEHNVCAKIFNSSSSLEEPSPKGPAKFTLARKTLDVMTHHRDLACVRDESNLARLPDPERKEWQAFWSEVDALLKKADQD